MKKRQYFFKRKREKRKPCSQGWRGGMSMFLRYYFDTLKIKNHYQKKTAKPAGPDIDRPFCVGLCGQPYLCFLFLHFHIPVIPVCSE
jgi:hypothetical protein